MNRLVGLFRDKRNRVIGIILIVMMGMLIGYQVYRYQDPFKYASVSISDESYSGSFASQSMIHDSERIELIQAVKDTKILGEADPTELKHLADATFSKGIGINENRISIYIEQYRDKMLLYIGENGEGKYIVISKDSAIIQFMDELYASRGMRLGGEYGITY